MPIPEETAPPREGDYSASTKASSKQKIDLQKLHVHAPLLHKLDNLYQVPLHRLEVSFGVVSVDDEYSKLQRVMRKTCRDNGANVTILMAIRQAS